VEGPTLVLIGVVVALAETTATPVRVMQRHAA
jgi:hypothetical protein